ncbi:transcription elongation factor GreA [bacterium]|nr:transcription elongation factor GreA [bacterium]
MIKENYLTKEGLQELTGRLNNLKTVRRREIADEIHAAKEQGDLSENAEYQQAKDEQRRVEGKITELEATIKHAQIIEKTDGTEVNIGNTVTLQCGGNEKIYRIVGSNEADPLQGKISNESPMGLALLGKKKAEDVSIPTPAGDKQCQVMDIG